MGFPILFLTSYSYNCCMLDFFFLKDIYIGSCTIIHD